MDRLPAALVVWMPVLTDAGPANLLLPDRRGSVAGLAVGQQMARKLKQTGVPTGTMSV